MNIDILESQIELENDKVRLIPFENIRNKEPQEVVFDDEIWKYMGMFVRTISDFENYISNTIKDKEKRICYPFLIIDKKSGKIAGSARYGNLNSSSQKCEIGWTWYGK